MMKKITKVFLVSLIVACFVCCTKEQPPVKDQNTSFYIGTYTNGKSEGIYQSAIDKEGKFIEGKLVAKTQNPSFLALSSDKKHLVAVNEIDENGEGAITSYKIVKDSLIFVNAIGSGGAHPCYVKTYKNHVYVANYTGGNMSLASLTNGTLSKVDVQQHEGKGTTSRQEAPHVHSVNINTTSDEIIAVDLGTNELWFSKINPDSQKLALTSQGKLAMQEGAGPRHTVFHPTQKNWLYVLNELNGTVSLVVKNEEGIYEEKSSISMLPEDFKEYNIGADIHISADGKFLYASNRGHNSLAIFSIDPDNGDLALAAIESVKGNWPRNFAISPDGNFVLVANQFSNTIVSFQRNSQTGLLTFVDELKLDAPVCILF